MPRLEGLVSGRFGSRAGCGFRPAGGGPVEPYPRNSSARRRRIFGFNSSVVVAWAVWAPSRGLAAFRSLGAATTAARQRAPRSKPSASARTGHRRLGATPLSCSSTVSGQAQTGLEHRRRRRRHWNCAPAADRIRSVATLAPSRQPRGGVSIWRRCGLRRRLHRAEPAQIGHHVVGQQRRVVVGSSGARRGTSRSRRRRAP